MSICVIALLSCFYANNQKQKYDKLYNNIKECLIEGTVVEEPIYKYNVKKYIVKVEKVNDKNEFKNTKIIVYEKNNKITNIKYGNLIKFRGNFEIPSKSRNYCGFNYNEYLRANGIYGIVSVDENSMLICKNRNINWYSTIINSVSNWIKNRIYEILPSKSADLYTAIFIGDKSNLDETIINDFSESSLSHVLAVSGMHMSYMVSIVSVIFSACGKKVKAFVIIASVIMFCNISGNSYSVVRASIMIIIYISAGLFHRKSDSLTNICVAAVAILVYNPYAIKSMSFILSFSATLSIIIFNNIVTARFRRVPENNFLGKYIKNALCLSISANIILIPISAVYFNKISVTFLITGLISTFLLSLIMPIGFLSLFVSCFSSIITKISSYILNILLTCLICTSKIKLFSVYITKQEIAIITILSLVLVYGYMLKGNIKHKKIIKDIIIVFMMVCIIITVLKLADKNMYINFVDVGQGDCTLIRTPTGKKVLIDGGGKENSDNVGKKILVPYLLNRGIKKIDYIIISHFDTDHVGGILTIIEYFNVKNVIISKQYEESENYYRFQDIVKKRGINVVIVNKGDRLYIEKNVYFDFLWPNDQNIISENILNNNSIVCKLCYNGFSMLFTGDIEEIAEKSILQEYRKNEKVLESTIIKVAHHGSKTSSTVDFLNAASPQISLIGVGQDNKFGHPSEEIIDRLKNIRM